MKMTAVMLRRVSTHARRPIISRGWRMALSSTSTGDSTRDRTEAKPMEEGLTPEQVRRVGERFHAIQAEHLRLKTDVPHTSLDPSSPHVDALTVRKKRMIYRSKQRGWLEVDLLLGSWAVENVHGLSEQELNDYEALLNLETVDIYNVLTGREDPPERIQASPVYARLKEYAMSAPFGKASKAEYERVKEKAGLT